jgi:tetratricopeptide (TPR) repeat protein
MNCKGAEEIFIEFLYGELDPERTEALRAHLGVCPACAARLNELARVREMVSQRPDPEPSSLAVQRVLAHARGEGTVHRPFWGLGWLKAVIPLCFAVIIGGWIVFQYTLTEQAKAPPALRQRAEEQTRPPQAPLIKEGPAPQTAPEPEKAKEFLPAQPRLDETPSAGKLGRAERPEASSESGPSLSPEKGSIQEETKVRVMPKEAERLRAPAAPSLIAPDVPTEPAPTRTTAPLKGRQLPATPPASDKGVEATGRAMDLEARPKIAAPAPLAQAPGVGGAAAPSVSSLMEEGEAFLKAREFQQAEEAFSQALHRLPRRHPDRPRALLGLARANEDLGRYGEASRLYETLADESPAHRDEALRKVRELGSRGD